MLLNQACASGLVKSSIATSNAVLGIMYGSPASSLTTHQDAQLLGFLE